jgi:RNA polymerase sigma factor (sigma-70 family)
MVLKVSWRIFYSRFAPYLYKVVVNKCRNYPAGMDMANDCLQESFIKAVKGIHKFQFKPGLDADAKEKYVKAWLGKIAKHVFLKEIKKWDSLELPEDTQSDDEDVHLVAIPQIEDCHFQEEDEPIEIVSGALASLRKAMSTFSERERDVVLAYADEGCIGTGLHLSAITMTHLCKKYNTTPENIRKIKSRTLKKLHNLCLPT